MEKWNSSKSPIIVLELVCVCVCVFHHSHVMKCVCTLTHSSSCFDKPHLTCNRSQPQPGLSLTSVQGGQGTQLRGQAGP